MTFKMMATVAAVAMAAGANCGCSAVPSGLQAQNTYGAAGRAAPARGAAYATSPTVEIPGERVIGADPDANVRLELTRDAAFHLHGSGN
jgi:hypothetical protein